jgi:hypothetical protein
MAGLDVTVAACLTGQALNVGYGPVATAGVSALERRRIGPVGRIYLRATGYTAANPQLVAKQAGIGFAQMLGGGHPLMRAGAALVPVRLSPRGWEQATGTAGRSARRVARLRTVRAA